jgi:hypothetical protein
VSPGPAPSASNIADLRIERPSIARQIGRIGGGRPAPTIAYVLIETPLIPSQVGAHAFDPGVIARQVALVVANVLSRGGNGQNSNCQSQPSKPLENTGCPL